MKTRISKQILILSSIVLLLGACSGEPDRKILIERYVPNNLIADCIDVSLQSPETIQVGEGFTASLKITNTCSQAIEVKYGAGSDLLITKPDGETIWQRYQGGPIITILYVMPLASGESFEGATFTWDGRDSKNKRLSEGDYQVVAMFDTITPGTIESVKSFKITN